MKIEETFFETVEKKKLLFMACDKCRKYYDDPYEIQEFHQISFTGGYGSAFGDMTKIECDICQHCLKVMINGIYREDYHQYMEI